MRCVWERAGDKMENTWCSHIKYVWLFFHYLICITTSMTGKQTTPLNSLSLNISFMNTSYASAGCNWIANYCSICISWLQAQSFLYKMPTSVYIWDLLKDVHVQGGRQLLQTCCKSVQQIELVRESKNRVIVNTSFTLSLRATGAGGCHREATWRQLTLLLNNRLLFLLLNYNKLHTSSCWLSTHPLESPPIVPRTSDTLHQQSFAHSCAPFPNSTEPHKHAFHRGLAKPHASDITFPHLYVSLMKLTSEECRRIIYY